MLKKLVVVALCGGLAFAALRGTKVFSYARQSVDDASEWATDQVPPEKEIARLRGEIKQLDAEVLKVAGLLAKENVEVRDLRQTVSEIRTKQSEQKEVLKVRGASIKAATETVSFGDRVLPVAQAKAELAESVNRYASGQKTLATLDQTLASRDRNRESLEKQLDSIKNQRKEQTAEVDALEAEINLLKLQQIENKYQSDNSRLASIKDSIRDMRKRVEVKREQLRLAPSVHEDRPAAATGNKSVDEILSGLGDSKPEIKKTGVRVAD